MKYGFLGTGKMSGAIIGGMISSGFMGEDILGYNRGDEKIDELKNALGIIKCKTRKELLEKSDVLFLGVKPNVLDEILIDIRKELGNNKPLIVSIAVGKTIEYFESSLSKDFRVARVMPNINSLYQASTSGYCYNDNVTDEDKGIIEEIFGAIGTIEYIKEDHFSIFAAIAGSSPAFAYTYINALANAAVKAGMPKEQALNIAASTVRGSAITILESDKNPHELADAVCSPGGTTIEGMTSLKKDSFETAVINAVDAVLAKDKIIREGNN